MGYICFSEALAMSIYGVWSTLLYLRIYLYIITMETVLVTGMEKGEHWKWKLEADDGCPWATQRQMFS